MACAVIIYGKVSENKTALSWLPVDFIAKYPPEAPPRKHKSKLTFSLFVISFANCCTRGKTNIVIRFIITKYPNTIYRIGTPPIAS